MVWQLQIKLVYQSNCIVCIIALYLKPLDYYGNEYRRATALVSQERSAQSRKFGCEQFVSTCDSIVNLGVVAHYEHRLSWVQVCPWQLVLVRDIFGCPPTNNGIQLAGMQITPGCSRIVQVALSNKSWISKWHLRLLK